MDQHECFGKCLSLTVQRLAAFNLHRGRDYTEEELNQAVKIHGVYASKAIIHARTLASMNKQHAAT